MDAVNAYLKGMLQETVYMLQHELFARVCRLTKAIYGLKQSGRVLNETIKERSSIKI